MSGLQYGCIGEHLTHSFSAQIHPLLADYAYELREIPQGTLADFMQARDFKGINVTIPYKQDVIPYLKEIDPVAAQIGAVNTIVNRDGALFGYNTDFCGMQALIEHADISLAGKKVLILGSGGTSNTAFAVAKHLGAACIHKVSRSGKNGTLTYAQASAAHTDAQILINTTPCGMFSREDTIPLSPTLFPQLSGVIDAVYNPLRTPFVLQAQSMGVKAAGGLYMLVMQAVRASEIFLDTVYPATLADTVYRKIKTSKENIVLTGMPASGKTTVGTLLAQKLNRPFIDTDDEIQKKTGCTPAQLITEKGETAFRDIETAVIRDLRYESGAIIATGGGAVLRAQNVRDLRQNGKLFFLNRAVELLVPTDDRPLSSSVDAVRKRFAERYDTYVATADCTIPANASPAAVADLVERSFFA